MPDPTPSASVRIWELMALADWLRPRLRAAEGALGQLAPDTEAHSLAAAEAAWRRRMLALVEEGMVRPLQAQEMREAMGGNGA